MISNWLSATLARRNIHYGWVMVGVTFLTALITAGTVGAPGVFIVPLQQEFGWTTAEISSALSIRFILFGLMAPFAAALLNRYGLRNVTLSALLIVASALLASLLMTKVWHLMLLWGVVIGVGTGMTALVLGATVAARWFSARRGLVVGILTASVATGQLIFLPLLAGITERMGWRIALSLVCVMLALAALAVLMVMRDRPSDVGLAAIRRRRRAALAGAPSQHRADHGGGARHAARCREDAGVLDFIRHVLHLRRQHQRPDPGASDSDVPRFRNSAGSGREPARRHGRVRFLRHHRLGVAIGPLRQSLAVVLVLWLARPVAAIAAVHRFFVLRPVAVCDVLWAGLDRNGAADGAIDRAALRAGARQSGVRLDFRRSSARRRRRGLRRRPSRALRLRPIFRHSSSPARYASWRRSWRFRSRERRSRSRRKMVANGEKRRKQSHSPSSLLAHSRPDRHIRCRPRRAQRFGEPGELAQ